MTVLALALAGAAVQLLEPPVRRRTPAEPPDFAGRAPGPGITLGLLGGFQAVAADFLWLRVQLAWEERDVPATQALVCLVTAVDPQPLYFWLNGARILAYDLPAWRTGGTFASAAVRRQIETEQADAALRYLDQARLHHPRSAAIYIEMANICLNGRKDVAAAAEFYRQAAGQPGAPYYAARIHAELLRRLGRTAEARDWLQALLPTLPTDDEAAMEGVVRARLRELERELGLAQAPDPEAGTESQDRACQFRPRRHLLGPHP